jgi:hypothetical protein
VLFDPAGWGKREVGLNGPSAVQEELFVKLYSFQFYYPPLHFIRLFYSLFFLPISCPSFLLIPHYSSPLLLPSHSFFLFPFPSVPSPFRLSFPSLFPRSCPLCTSLFSSFSFHRHSFFPSLTSLLHFVLVLPLSSFSLYIFRLPPLRYSLSRFVYSMYFT